MDASRYITVKEFATATGYSKQAITQWCRKGRLRALQPAGVGGLWRIHPGEIERLAKEGNHDRA